MRTSQYYKALAYARDKYNITSLTFRELFNIRYEMDRSNFSEYDGPTHSEGQAYGQIFSECNRRVNPKIARVKDDDNLWRYYLL